MYYLAHYLVHYLGYYQNLTFHQAHQDIFIPYMYHFISYWIGSAIFFGIDYYLVQTNQILKYKIQGNEIMKRGNLDWDKYYKTACYVLWNMIFVTLPCLVAVAPLIEPSGLRSPELLSQGWYWIAIKTFLMIVISDFIFTFAHYSFHHPYLYKYHKIHHEWTAPVAVRSIYAHPFEHLGANLSSMIIPLWIVRFPFNYAGYWTILITLNTLKSHSGLNIRHWILTADDHDLHHKLFKYNYGFTSIWDYALGTYLSMDEYLEWKKLSRATSEEIPTKEIPTEEISTKETVVEQEISLDDILSACWPIDGKNSDGKN